MCGTLPEWDGWQGRKRLRALPQWHYGKEFMVCPEFVVCGRSIYFSTNYQNLSPNATSGSGPRQGMYLTVLLHAKHVKGQNHF
jgi:hypothetical protein